MKILIAFEADDACDPAELHEALCLAVHEQDYSLLEDLSGLISDVEVVEA